MTGLEIFEAILLLLAGLGVFLYGMKMMSDSLETIASNQIKGWFSKISSNKLVGVGVGMVTTAIIQSSSAVTVMLIGFVNAGLMTLGQVPSIIFGANIGTTITAQLVAIGFSSNSFSLSALFAAFTGIGAMALMFSKNDKVKKISTLMVGLGMLFLGLDVMGDSMKGIGENYSYVFSTVTNPFLLLLIGIIFTAIIQSSSAASGIFITMAVGGMLTLEQSVYLIIGSNIGTCVTAVIASIGGCINAKRTALLHLNIKIFGTIAFMIFLFIPGVKFSYWIETAFPGNIALQVAMVHTIFNVAATVVLLPFSKQLVKLSCKILPDKKGKEVKTDEPRLHFFEKHMLSTPPIAISYLKKEIINMGEMAKNNLDMAMDSFVNLDTKKVDEIMKREKELDYLSKEIPKIIVQLSNSDISLTDKKAIGSYYHVVADFERIGDYAENITEYTQTAIDEKTTISEKALSEVKQMKSSVDTVYDLAMQIFTNVDLSLEEELDTKEEVVDKEKEVMAYKHISRMKEGICSAEAGALYLNMANDLERVADHMCNIADSIKSYVNIKPKNELRKNVK